jgi:hypothetical protein
MPARLHLDEDGRRPVARDDVDFAMPGAVAAGKNGVPAAAELGAREIFAHYSEDLAVIVGHATQEQA